MTFDLSTHRLQPLDCLITQAVLAATTIFYTKNKSFIRIPTLAIIIGLGFFEIDYAVGTNHPKDGMTAACGFLYTAQLVNILWFSSVSRADFEQLQDGDKRGHQLKDVAGHILHLVVFNFRGIRTPWQTKNVPAFPKFYKDHVPRSRILFLARQLAIMVFQYLVLDLMASQLLQLVNMDREHLLGPGAEYTYLSSTRKQWVFRIYSSLAVRWVLHRAFLSITYNLVSFIGVASMLFRPEDFPPFMGSMWNAYTLRGYWGRFWHQTLRWPLTAMSTFITRDLFHLRSHGLLQRYSHIFGVFTLSGILHVLIDMGDGRTDLVPTFLFFQSFVVGIMLEDGTQALWRKYARQQRRSANEPVRLWHKVVGFVWVNVFFIIVGPLYFYPAVRQPLQPGTGMPFEVTSRVGWAVTGMLTSISGLIVVYICRAEV